MATSTTITEQDVLAARMEKLNVTQDFLAEYVGLSQGEVSKIVRGVRLKDSERDGRIEHALDELENLALIFGIIPLAFKDVQTTRYLVDAFKTQPEVKQNITTSQNILSAGLSAFAVQGK